jgi:hypothetical protein
MALNILVSIDTSLRINLPPHLRRCHQSISASGIIVETCPTITGI